MYVSRLVQYMGQACPGISYCQKLRPQAGRLDATAAADGQRRTDFPQIMAYAPLHGFRRARVVHE